MITLNEQHLRAMKKKAVKKQLTMTLTTQYAESKLR
jgi:hypothetical protein